MGTFIKQVMGFIYEWLLCQVALEAVSYSLLICLLGGLLVIFKSLTIFFD